LLHSIDREGANNQPRWRREFQVAKGR
jgi:hypothetical protein